MGQSILSDKSFSWRSDITTTDDIAWTSMELSSMVAFKRARKTLERPMMKDNGLLALQAIESALDLMTWRYCGSIYQYRLNSKTNRTGGRAEVIIVSRY